MVKATPKERLDKLLVDRGLATSRAKAQALILAGDVLVNGQPAAKAGSLIEASARLELQAALPYVSRGGLKLAAALDAFGVDVSGRVCADVGACTGGFTDVLLQRGAERVYAIDVGYGQLDWKLRQDSRVKILERTNARYLESLPEPVQLVVIDVSFISLKLIVPAGQKWLTPTGDLIALIKPQFEAGREQIGKGGLIKDPAIHEQVLNGILGQATSWEMTPAGLIRSPIVGASGNVEFLLWLRPGTAPTNVQELIAGVIRPGEN